MLGDAIFELYDQLPRGHQDRRTLRVAIEIVWRTSALAAYKPAPEFTAADRAKITRLPFAATATAFQTIRKLMQARQYNDALQACEDLGRAAGLRGTV
jgi:hypothetical protein